MSYVYKWEILPYTLRTLYDYEQSTYDHNLYVTDFTTVDGDNTYIIGKETHYASVDYQAEDILVETSEYTLFRYQDSEEDLYILDQDIESMVETFANNIHEDLQFYRLNDLWIGHIDSNPIVIITFQYEKGSRKPESYMVYDPIQDTVIYEAFQNLKFNKTRYTWWESYWYNIKSPIDMDQGRDWNGDSFIYLYFNESKKYRVDGDFYEFDEDLNSGQTFSNPNWFPGFEHFWYDQWGLFAHFSNSDRFRLINEILYSDGAEFDDEDEYESHYYDYNSFNSYNYTDILKLSGPKGYIDGNKVYIQAHQRRKESVTWDTIKSDQFSRIVRADYYMNSAFDRVAIQPKYYDKITHTNDNTYPMAYKLKPFNDNLFAVVNNYLYIKPDQKADWSDIKSGDKYPGLTSIEPSWETVEWSDDLENPSIVNFGNFSEGDRSHTRSYNSAQFPSRFLHDNDYIISFISDGDNYKTFAGFEDDLSAWIKDITKADDSEIRSLVGYHDFKKGTLKNKVKLLFDDKIISLERGDAPVYYYEEPTSLTIDYDNRIYVGGSHYFIYTSLPGIIVDDVSELTFDNSGDYTSSIVYRRDALGVSGYTLVKNDGGAIFVHGDYYPQNPGIYTLYDIYTVDMMDLSSGIANGISTSVDYKRYPHISINVSGVGNVYKYDYEDWTHQDDNLSYINTALTDFDNNHYIGHNGTTPEVEANKYGSWQDFNTGLPSGVIITDLEGDFYNDR
jgi:hypothetical protein